MKIVLIAVLLFTSILCRAEEVYHAGDVIKKEDALICREIDDVVDLLVAIRTGGSGGLKAYLSHVDAKSKEEGKDPSCIRHQKVVVLTLQRKVGEVVFELPEVNIVWNIIEVNYTGIKGVHYFITVTPFSEQAPPKQKPEDARRGVG